MSKRRNKGSGSSPVRSRGTKRWLVVGALMLAGLVVTFLLIRPNLPPLQEISTAGLEPEVSELIQRHVAAVRVTPRSGKAWGELGAVLKSYNFREPAGECLAVAERLDPHEPRWPYLYGALRAGESTAFAVTQFRRAVALCGNDPEMPRLRLARLLAETGQETAAREELNLLLRAKPNSGPARLLMAQFNFARSEWDTALTLANSCVTNPYTARAALTLLATLHLRRGDANAAALASRRAAAVTPDSPWPDPFEDEVTALRRDAGSLSSRAQTYLMAGRPSEALPLVERLVQEHPQFAQSWLLLGRTQNLLNQPAVAEQALRRFVQMDPSSVNGHFQLGMSLLTQKRFPEAADVFRHAITLKPDFGPAFFNLGFALAKSGNQREAITAFQEAIRHNPEKIDTYILLADLHLQLGENNEATRLAELAAQIDAADPRLRALHAKIRQD